VAFTADVRMHAGHHLAQVERLVAGGEFTLEMSEDSTSFHLEVSPKGQQVVLFTTDPADAEVRFEIEAQGEAGSGPVHTGGGGTEPMGQVFAMTPGQALGIPDAFDEFRSSGRPGACVWWLPGKHTVQSRETTTLSPEERKRLKALGYIQ
jgi:hypothetical protein